MLPSQEPTDKMAEVALREMLDAVPPLVSRFQMELAEKNREKAYAMVVLANEVCSVRIDWDPRDRYMYRVGPVVEGKLPLPDISYEVGRSLNQYSLDSFVALAGKDVPMEVRQAAAMAKSSVDAGIRALIAYAQRFLQGDWTQRAQLDEIVRQNYQRWTY